MTASRYRRCAVKSGGGEVDGIKVALKSGAKAIIVPTMTETGTLFLEAQINGSPVAHAVFRAAADGDAVECFDIDVAEALKRQGIGSALYAAAERSFGLPAIPSKALTPESVAFWQARGATLPLDAVVKTYAAWYAVSD